MLVLFEQNKLTHIHNWSVQGLLKRGWRKVENRSNGQNQVLLLCPLDDFQYIPNETQLWDVVTGQLTTKGRDTFDWKTQAGMLRYGIWCSVSFFY